MKSVILYSGITEDIKCIFTTNFNAIEIIHSQHCTTLILVAQEAEPLGFARFLVAHQVDVHQFTEPEKNTWISLDELLFDVQVIYLYL